MQMWERNVQYLGRIIDTIEIVKIEDLRIPIGENKILISEKSRNEYSKYGNCKLEIYVDTLQKATLLKNESVLYKRINVAYKAFPIFILNKSNETTIIGTGYNIPIILEALDRDNIWKPIEAQYIHDCGVGLEYLLLKENNLVCVLCPIYIGDFKTKLRYKLGSNYSNEFIGTINREQFIENEKTFEY